MKNLLKLLIGLLFLGIIVVSCEKDPDEKEIFKPDNSSRIIVNNDAKSLSKRVNYFKDHVMSINDVPGYNTNGLKKGTKQHLEDENYVLKLRAEVEPYMHNGFALRATHVKIRGIYAYVSYNVEGAVYLGGVEVFDVSDIENPQLVSQAIFEDTDVSAIDVSDDGYLYLASATNMDLHPELNSPAILEKIKLDNGLLTAESEIVDIASYVATEVKLVNDLIFVTSGDNGGATVLDPATLEQIEYVELADARSVDADDDFVVVMQGTPARLNKFSAITGEFIESFNVGGADIAWSKSAVELYNGSAFLSAGNAGMKMIDLATGEIVNSLPRPVIPGGATPGDYVTNAVSVNHDLSVDLVLVANGAAGVYVASLYDDLSMNFIGQMDFQSSTNFVEGKNNVVFVATGFGGLRILEIVYYNPETGDYIDLCDYDEDGVPYCLDEDEILCETLLPSFYEVLPEYENAIENHPDYFENTPTNLLLSEEAEVFVTFVNEAAGFRNVLGYYAYPADNPPATKEEIDEMVVIFANASLPGLGGDLEPGNKVSLGTFPANTVIEYFILSDGWNGEEVTNGIYQIFSNPGFNSNGLQQNLLFWDEECSKIILTFEDIEVPGGDKDFNDVIFTVGTEPASAINVDSFISISGLYE